MAGAIIEGSAAEIACAANTTVSVLRVKAPSQQGVKILSWGVSFDGVAPTDQPLQVVLNKETTDGTYTALTPVKVNSFSWTPQSSWGSNASAAGTSGDSHDPIEVHPQQGYEKLYPLGQEIQLAGGERLAIQVSNPSGNSTVNCRPKIRIEE